MVNQVYGKTCKIYESEKPYHCYQCDKHFDSNVKLNEHMQKDHTNMFAKSRKTDCNIQE